MKKEKREMEEDLKISKYVYGRLFNKYHNLKDDLIQESLIALWRARPRFDSTKGAYSNFAINVSVNAMKMFLRKELRHSNNLSLDDLQIDFEDESIDFENSIDLELRLKFLSSKCNDKENNMLTTIVNMFKKGLDPCEIFKELKISSTYFYKLLKKFQAKSADILS